MTSDQGGPMPQTMGQQFGRRSWAEPWKIKMVEPLTQLDRARPRAGDPRRRLQHVPPPLGGRVHRPADRLRHVGDERPPVGRDDARRRGLRRQSQLLPPRGRRPALLRLPLPRADPPGPRRRAPHQPDAHQGRRPRARQHVLHDDPAPPGAGRGDLPRRHHRRGPRPASRSIRSRATWTWPRSSGSSPRSAPSGSPT